MNGDDIIEAICLERGIKLSHQDDVDCSCIYGNDEIVLGQYKNPELRFISFFHELGHTLVTQDFKAATNYNTLLIELKAWDLGIEFAISRDIVFSDDAIVWGYGQALTYAGHDERECSNFVANYTVSPR
jgi:hypothetical protein